MQSFVPKMWHVLLLLQTHLVWADLRLAAQPRRAYVVDQRTGSIPFIKTEALYMEPDTFGYQGLENQKRRNYDNFLRSNIDNEQDNRNFNTEPGKDHLPFRTMEAQIKAVFTDVRRRRNPSPTIETVITVKP